MTSKHIVEKGRQSLLREFALAEAAREREVKEDEGVEETRLAPVASLSKRGSRSVVQRIIEDAEGEDLEVLLAKYPASYFVKRYGLARSTVTMWKRRLGWEVVGGIRFDRVNRDKLIYTVTDKRYKYLKEIEETDERLQA